MKSIRGRFRRNPITKKFEPCAPNPARVRSAQVRTDDVPEGIQSMATGRWYTSKARLREEYKSRGLEEVGNDLPTINDKGQVEKEATYVKSKIKSNDEQARYDAKLEADVATARTMVRDGMAPLTEFDKKQCETINKQIKDSTDGRERPYNRID